MKNVLGVIAVLVLNLAAYRTMLKAPYLWVWVTIIYMIVAMGLLYASDDYDEDIKTQQTLICHSAFMFIAAVVMLTVKFW